MNSRQFLSSTLFRGVDWGVSTVPIIGPVLAWPFRIAFPTMGYERVDATLMRRGTFFSIYLLGFLLCFVVQAFLALHAERLGTLDGTFGATLGPAPGLEPGRIMFFDDIYNLINYALLVPLYLVAGTGYMISLFSLSERMAPLASEYGFALENHTKPLLSGIAAVGVFFLLLILVQAGYAVDVQEKSEHLFWFHGETTNGSFTYNGYAYLVINILLSGFVIFVALLHVELFRWSSVLSQGIRTFSVKSGDDNVFLNNGNKLKELLSPFTETAIWSKAFAMLLAFNVYTWKASGVSGGHSETGVDETSWFFRFSLVLFIIIALWIVSLPRYRVQYQIFKLRSQSGVHEYFDIRMPWTIGWSVFIDILLLAFFSSMIFSDNDVLKLFQSLF